MGEDEASGEFIRGVLSEHRPLGELGQDEYSSSLVRALYEGGMVWEGSAHYETLDEACILHGQRTFAAAEQPATVSPVMSKAQATP